MWIPAMLILRRTNERPCSSSGQSKGVGFVSWSGNIGSDSQVLKNGGGGWKEGVKRGKERGSGALFSYSRRRLIDDLLQ